MAGPSSPDSAHSTYIVGLQDNSLPGSLPPLLTLSSFYFNISTFSTSLDFQRDFGSGLPLLMGSQSEDSAVQPGIFSASSGCPHCFSFALSLLAPHSSLTAKSIIALLDKPESDPSQSTPDAPDLCAFSRFM